ncbi:NAD(P)/FAD-dependent oxidoreductase [Cohnella sp. 56]|uniref:NAD(P)/FAD-dependent oxidoreductase n=1 Tax=Cohnella sp. 56 TaxID=3113722 RepID=UPI0030E985EB
MDSKTIVVVGGGYAGIHAVSRIRKEWKQELSEGRLKLVLIDRQPYHLRKVLLFQPAAGGQDIRLPFERMFPQDVTFMQAAVTGIDRDAKTLTAVGGSGEEIGVAYDWLVLAAGSVVRRPDPAAGGMPLADVDDARRIGEAWRDNLKRAAGTADPAERRRWMTVAVAGAGISGIETSAELAHYMRAEAQAQGLDPAEAGVVLLNAHGRLFPEGPAKVGEKLAAALAEAGVQVVHGSKAVQATENEVCLADGRRVKAGLCVWTLGLLPSPLLRGLGLPLAPDGCLLVDGSYRVPGADGVYAIGDCARIVDAATGRADGKTCKEASAQAARLAKVIAADRDGRAAPAHKSFMDFFCFGLGPERGMAWTRQWGLDIVVTGKLGWRIRRYTWDLASLLN